MNPQDAFKEFETQYENKKKNQRRPTVLVAGYTGSGKTSLIQSICGKEIVPDDKIGVGLPKTNCFDRYEYNNIRFFDSKGLEPGDSEKEFIDGVNRFLRELQEINNVDDHVHIVWYTIQGAGARVTPCDLRLIKDLFPNSQVLAITKNDITRPNQLEGMEAVLIENGIKKDRIVPCSDKDKISLRKLEELTFELLPGAYKDAWASAQIINIERKHNKAQAIVHAAALAAAGVAATPIPFSDSILITPIQMGMIASLAALYSEPSGVLKAALMPLIAESIGVQSVASLTKLIPGNVFIAAGVAFALTEAIGQITTLFLHNRCKARINGDPVPEFSFDPSEFIRIFKEVINKNK